jgi:2-keto-3-deoxy-L-rhamnonate aldolase RhmA
MQPNRVKAALREGRAVAGPIVSEARSVGTIKLLAREGYDFLFLDMEHAMFGWETMLTLVQTALLCDVCPLVRVTDLSYPLVARALDTGAQGIIIPRVDNREQVDAAVSYAKYPPLGRRGAGGDARAAYQRLDAGTIVERANAETMVVVQVESREGLKNLDGIAAVPGLDVVCVGPQDLSISLGIPGEFGHPQFVEALRGLTQTCARHGVATGMVEREATNQKRWYDLGMRFLVTGADGYFIAKGAAEAVATVRGFAGEG